MRARLALTVSLALTMGCQMMAPTATTPLRPKAGRPVAARPSPGLPATQPRPLTDQTRTVALGAAEIVGKVKLIGKVKLLSDKGLGIISNNTGGLVSNNGGGLISDKGLGYRVQAAAEENLLADAQIEVLDGAGKVLVDEDGEAIVAKTDAAGGYRFEATLPQENLVLRVRLWNGGVLLALLTAGGEAERTIDIDTASALGTSYVLEKYVQQRQAVLDLLPGLEAEALKRDMEAARALLEGEPPRYQPEEMVALAETLRGKATALDGTLERIASILLAGQKNLGEGLPATSVALASPVSLAMTPAGELVVAEGYAGRIRVIGTDGRVRTLVAARTFGPDAAKVELGVIADMRRAPDGTILIAEPLATRVRRITPGGVAEVVAGAPAGLKNPTTAAFAPDGSIYIGEAPGYPEQDGATGRIMRVAPDGTVAPVPMPEAQWDGAQITGLEVAPDGTIYVAAQGTSFVARKRPGAAWEFSTHEFHGHMKRLLVAPDGAIYVSEMYGRRIWRYDFTSAPVLVAGTGVRGYDGDGGPAIQARFFGCTGMALGRDGTLYVADGAQGTVRAIDPAGIIRTIAGGAGSEVVGDALEVPVNSPSGAVYDSTGRLLIAETAGQSIKRLEDGRWSLVAGGGDEYDLPSAQGVRLNSPVGLAFQGQDLIVADMANGLIRKVKPDGTTALLAGVPSLHGQMTPVTAREVPALETGFARPTGVAVSPAGEVYFTDTINGLVVRLDGTGTAHVVAGLPAGEDGKPQLGAPVDGAQASESKLNRPFGLAFDAAGTMYISDVGTMRIYKVTPEGVISAFAGLDQKSPAGFAKLLSPAIKPGDSALQILLGGPAGLAVGPDGDLYVAVAGTSSLKLAGNLMPLPDDLPLDQFKVPPSVLRLSPDGSRVEVVAGPGSRVLPDPDAEEALVLPIGLAFSPAGRLAIVDLGANQIRAIP